ncbi:MAG: hypothetical protein L0214_03870 [candidate division NC10 bacterium]|nr:hypothetical protein [candidate division NC10 bacterium]
MPPVTFCFGVHAHQPVGNFDHVIARSCELAYASFLSWRDLTPASGRQDVPPAARTLPLRSSAALSEPWVQE